MSRSFKHTPIQKHNDQDYKRISSKRFRRRPIDETNAKPYHYTCSYDISDFKYYDNSDHKGIMK